MSNGIDFMTAMSMPRKQRRLLAKISGGKKIVGSTKPYKKDIGQ